MFTAYIALPINPEAMPYIKDALTSTEFELCKDALEDFSATSRENLYYIILNAYEDFYEQKREHLYMPAQKLYRDFTTAVEGNHRYWITPKKK